MKRWQSHNLWVPPEGGSKQSRWNLPWRLHTTLLVASVLLTGCAEDPRDYSSDQIERLLEDRGFSDVALKQNPDGTFSGTGTKGYTTWNLEARLDLHRPGISVDAQYTLRDGGFSTTNERFDLRHERAEIWLIWSGIALVVCGIAAVASLTRYLNRDAPKCHRCGCGKLLFKEDLDGRVVKSTIRIVGLQRYEGSAVQCPHCHRDVMAQDLAASGVTMGIRGDGKCIVTTGCSRRQWEEYQQRRK